MLVSGKNIRMEAVFEKNAVLIDRLSALMSWAADLGALIMPGNGVRVKIARQADELIRSGTLVGMSEEELLARFVERRDSLALEMIVDRHGPLVLTVCRQLLVDPNDIDDAFQATFLVLIHRAASVRRPGSLASWLHGVAYRTALRLKRTSRPIRLLTDQVECSVSCPINEHEQNRLLHEEIDRLPEKYRRLKWTVLALTASSIVLVAAGTGLRALASQVESKPDVDLAQQKAITSKQPDFAKVYAKSSLRRTGVAGKLEFDPIEELADLLERHRVEAELLEIQTQSLKGRLKTTLDLLRNMEIGNGPQGKDYAIRLEKANESMTDEYTQKRLRLARLRRQIERETKALNQPMTEARRLV
jgi:RNA polymerase sigma factor (sigma-70 family)